jgi:gluconolactonase
MKIKRILSIILFTTLTTLLFIGESCFSSRAQSFANKKLFKSAKFTPANSFAHGLEGPAVDKFGNIYAVNFFHEGTIGIVTPSGDPGLFVGLPYESIGNGIRFNSHGNMLIADYKMHNVLKVDMKTKRVGVFAHEPRMTQPNDLAFDSKDRIYDSDPNFKLNTGRIWRIDTNDNITLLDSLSGPANGIERSRACMEMHKKS